MRYNPIYVICQVMSELKAARHHLVLVFLFFFFCFQLSHHRRDRPRDSEGAWYSGTFMSRLELEYPRSSAAKTAHFSPIRRAAYRERKKGGMGQHISRLTGVELCVQNTLH